MVWFVILFRRLSCFCGWLFGKLVKYFVGNGLLLEWGVVSFGDCISSWENDFDIFFGYWVLIFLLIFGFLVGWFG